MDRSAHVWGKYKALLTVISSYNWWVGFHYISFSWLTAFLKSPLNGKLIGWLNLHFNQSIYERGSARNSLAEGEATFPQGLGQGVGVAVCPLTCPFSRYLSKVSVQGKGEHPRGLLLSGHALINLQEKGPDASNARRRNASHPCMSSVTGCQMPAPGAATAPKTLHQGLHVGGSDILA